MKKPRTKKYVPKRVSTNPIYGFFGNMSHNHYGSLQDTLIANHTALSNIARGVGDAHDWNRLNGAVNMALVMCESGFGGEHYDAFIAGRDAMLAMVRRAIGTERYIFKGDELRALNECMDAHDAQLACVRSIDVDNAAKEVERRVRHRINVASIHETTVEQIRAN